MLTDASQLLDAVTPEDNQKQPTLPQPTLGSADGSANETSNPTSRTLRDYDPDGNHIIRFRRMSKHHRSYEPVSRLTSSHRLTPLSSIRVLPEDSGRGVVSAILCPPFLSFFFLPLLYRAVLNIEPCIFRSARNQPKEETNRQ